MSSVDRTVALGRFIGRFGNHVFQYMFIKAYAERNGLTAQVPPWVGNELFDVADPLPTGPRRTVYELPLPGASDAIIPNARKVFEGCAFEGYFQYHSSYYRPYREYLQTLLAPRPEVHAALQPAREQLARRGRTLVGLHVRRGDYGWGHFYRTPIKWYREWLARIWPTLDAPVLFIATDDVSVASEFSQYSPLTVESLGCSLPRAPFYPDFYLLTQCDVLAIPASSFSFAAAMLNRGLRLSVRSRLPARAFVPFDPWDDIPIHRADRVEYFPDIPELAAPGSVSESRVRRYLERQRLRVSDTMSELGWTALGRAGIAEPILRARREGRFAPWRKSGSES